MPNGKQISFLNRSDYDHCVYIIFTYFVKKHVKWFNLNAIRELYIVIRAVEQG